MSKSNFIRQTASGAIYIKDRKDKEYLINPNTVYENSSKNKRRGTDTKSTKFKLVTVRRLTNYTLEDTITLLTEQQSKLRDTALRNKQPIPFESTLPVTEEDLQQVYGVYIDEDLYGQNQPVYVFSSPIQKIKCFITANGEGRYDYSVHICHAVSIKLNVNNTRTVNWRLYTIDNNLNTEGTDTYLFESSSLPPCFSYNFDINGIHYLGGGSWSSMAVSIDDRIPIYDIAPVDGRYITVGTPVNFGNGLKARSIVEYSFTPTYSFTWCRGQLELNRRIRNASSKYSSGDGLVYLDKSYDYSLQHTIRPNFIYGDVEITEYKHKEFSNATARYVGTTNDKICSPYQCPDYGTDGLRTSLESYSQYTNIIRPTELETQLQLPDNKISYQQLSHIPILVASNDMSTFIRANTGEALGSVNHGYELKATSGSRSYGYSYDYKLWWTYGKVVNFYPYGDTKLYRVSRSVPDPVPIGSMFDLGDLVQAPDNPNAVMTTWNAPVNPPSGFFPYNLGTLSFIIQYINPPIFGHNCIYYYEINPPFIEGGEAENNYRDNFDEGQELKKTQLLYSTILASMGGNGLSESYIGNVNIAASETETLLMRQPTATHRATIRNNPEYFPNQFWTRIDFTLENN